MSGFEPGPEDTQPVLPSPSTSWQPPTWGQPQIQPPVRGYNLPAPVEYQRPQPMYVPAVHVANQQNNDMGATTLILGLLVFVTFGLTSIPAVICGHISLARIKRGQSNATGLTWIGLVCGYLAIAGWLFWWFIVTVSLGAGAGSGS